MRKFTILFLSMMLFSLLSEGQIISQYIETNSGTSPKGIEIWNNTDSELDFSVNELVIEKGTNGGTPSEDFTLSDGTLASGVVIVIGTSDLQTTAESNGAVFYDKSFTFNGNDALVVKYGGTTTDVFGEPGVDPGSAWEGNGVSTANQNIALLGGISSGDTDGWSDPSGRFETVNDDPTGTNGDEGFGVAPESGGNASPSITNITQTPEEPTSTDPVSVTADITDSDGTIQTAELHWGTTSGDLTNTISMSPASGDTYETDSDIPMQTHGTEVYYEIYAEDNEGDGTTSTELSYTVSDSENIFYEPFDSDLGQMLTEDVEGDQSWEYGSFGNPAGSAAMSGYDGEAFANQDWLIIPEMNLTDYESVTLNFDEAINYADGNIDNEQEVYVSTDYSGSGDPEANGTWTKLTVTGRASGSSWDYVPVDEVDLSAYDGESTLFIGFKYTSTTSNAASWQVDNITVDGIFTGTNESPVISAINYAPEDPTSTDPVSVTADITDSDGTIQTAELHWGTTSGDLTNTINMSPASGDTYETDSDILAQADGTTVYFEVYAMDDGGAETTSPEQSYTVTNPATATLPYLQPFDADFGDTYTYNAIGDQEWYWNTFGNPEGSATMSGFDGEAFENENWLITPEFDFSGDINTVLNFDEAINYGTDNIDTEQEVYLSTDYAGIGDPSAATWEKLTVTGRASGDSWDFVSVDEIDLSAYDGETSVHIAFKYTSTTGGAATWEVDNISVEQLGEEGQITVTSPNGGESWEQGTSHDITWTSANLTGDVKIELQSEENEVLAETTEDDGVFTWDIPADQPVSDNYLIVITSVDDETVSDSSDEPFSITAPYVPGDLVITEIMYNPPESGNDSLEYVEVYNLGDFDVNLEGYYFEGFSFTFPDVTLAADDYIVVALNQSAFEGFFGGTALEWSSGALSNGGETVSLYDFDGTLIDEVPYGDGEPWPLDADGDGPSLTLCDPSLDNAVAENWSASDEYAGMNDEEAMVFGTPGAPCGDLNMVADFEALETEIAVGESATFIDLTSGGVDYWEWEFEGGDPATSNLQNPDEITYSEAGTYDVTLTVYNETGTTSVTKEDYISVVAGPEADFSADVTTIAIDGEVTFTDESTGDPTSWEWTFEGGDPATFSGQNPPAVSYASEGTYDVTLTVSNEYGESTEVKTDYIEVTPEPAANFEATETILLAGESTTFNDLSSGNPTGWEWEFEGGDPSTYSGQNPPAITYENTGSFDVTLTVSNDLGENILTREDYIIVGLEPVADFESSAQNIVEGATVQFIDLSENDPDSWSWSFNGGTPSSSGLQNPEVTYNDFGVYSVILEVSNMFGSDVEAKVDYIAVDADGIEELSLKEEKMIVYPNPAVDMVNVVLHSGMQGIVTLRSATGNKVMEKTILKRNAEFNINNLPQGIYFVEFIDEASHQRITKRLIVK